MRKFIKWCAWIGGVLLVAGCIGGTIYLNQLEKSIEVEKQHQTEAQKIAEAEHTKQALEQKIVELKTEVLAKIKGPESAGHTIVPGQLFYTNDPSSKNKNQCARIGGKRSIECDSWGPWQFKITTVIHYYKVLYAKDITEVEALLIALDDTKATALAEEIIFNVEGGVWNWSSASNGDQDYFKRQIPLIRELTAISK